MKDAFVNTEETSNVMPRGLTPLRLLFLSLFALLSLAACLGVRGYVDFLLRSKERNALIALATPELLPQRAQELLDRANQLSKEQQVLPFGIQRWLRIPKLSEANPAVFDLRVRLYKYASSTVSVDPKIQESLQSDLLKFPNAESKAFIPLLVQSMERVAEMDRTKAAKEAEIPVNAQSEKDEEVLLSAYRRDLAIAHQETPEAVVAYEQSIADAEVRKSQLVERRKLLHEEIKKLAEQSLAEKEKLKGLIPGWELSLLGGEETS